MVVVVKEGGGIRGEMVIVEEECVDGIKEKVAAVTVATKGCGGGGVRKVAPLCK